MHSMTPSNPFCTRFVRPGQIAYAFASDTADGKSLVNEVLRHRIGVIVGPHGTGKSTLLATLHDDLRDRFAAVVSLTLTAPAPGSRSPSWFQRRRRELQNWRQTVSASGRLSTEGLLILDGAEQLSRWHWRWLGRQTNRRKQTILATSHAALPGGRTLFGTGNSPDLIRSLTRDLVIETAPDLWTRVERELGCRKLDRDTNVRDLWFDLYDVVQPPVAETPV